MLTKGLDGVRNREARVNETLPIDTCFSFRPVFRACEVLLPLNLPGSIQNLWFKEEFL